MQRPPQYIGADQGRKRATLEYIWDLALQLAEMAEGVGAVALADALRKAAKTRTPPLH